jgi:hypothetical protein
MLIRQNLRPAALREVIQLIEKLPENIEKHHAFGTAQPVSAD